MARKGSGDTGGLALSRSTCNFAASLVMRYLIWLGCCTAIPISAQVFEVGGGNSSLYQAGGGSVTIHAPRYDFTLGAGTVNGHLLEGGHMVKATARGTYIYGDDRIDFWLPTDIFDISHYLQIRGLGFSTVRGNAEMIAYVGATSLDYSSPFFNGAKMNDPALLFFFKTRLTPRWQFVSDVILSSKPTMIEALQWTPAAKVEIAFAAGVGVGQPMAAVSLNLARPRFDLQAAYIAAGQNFHRVAGDSPLLAEPDRENILATIRPFQFLTLSGSHQNYLVPQYLYSSNLATSRSSIDQGSASLHVMGTQLNGTVYHSSYTQQMMGEESNHAAAFSALRDFTPRLHLTASYFVSKPKGLKSTESFISTLTERMNAHINVTESVTYSGGHTSANFGGEFISNRFTFSASYQTFYVPAQNAQPFEQALLLDAKVKVLGRLLLHGATFVDPTGKLRYTADAKTIVSHNQEAAEAAPIPMGRFILHGCVQDSAGTPIEGAALLVDERSIYTDSTGCFSMHESKPRSHRLSVVTSDFLVAGTWQVASMPLTIVSTSEDESPGATVVITLRRIPIVSGNPDDPSTSAGRTQDKLPF